MRLADLTSEDSGTPATKQRENLSGPNVGLNNRIPVGVSQMTSQDLGQELAEIRALVVRTNTPEVLTPREAADFLSVTDETLFRWRKDGVGPKYSQPNSRIVRYLRDDLISWMKEYQ